MRTKQELCLAFAFAAATLAVHARDRNRHDDRRLSRAARRARALKLARRICRRRSMPSAIAHPATATASRAAAARSLRLVASERQRQWMAVKLEQLREQHARLLYACGRRTVLR
ncbi:MAG TPA: hypothetical protein VND91_08920 [Candidatus Saccharimonadia bacterium]|nr:hypothetical protein [Candidatus Saccharimonadia bacterium]